jgi:hypothetical protein
MNKRIYGTFAPLLIVFAFFLFTAPYFFAAESSAKGNVIGFIYDKDAKTPLEGGIVKFKNLTSGTVLESSKSDNNGLFKLQGIESGVYTYGVITPEGDFNADNLVGIRVQENETAKMSIALNPYSKEEASAVNEVYKEQAINGESLIGTVADFNPGTQVAQIQVVKGLLQLKDKIHTKGKATDFYQEVGVLLAGNSKARRVLPGQVASVRLERKAAKGDSVYVVRKRNLFPMFLAPLGAASILAASSGVTYGVVKINDQSEPVSADKNH